MYDLYGHMSIYIYAVFILSFHKASTAVNELPKLWFHQYVEVINSEPTCMIPVSSVQKGVRIGFSFG
jgi:hypothetical protein